MFGATRSRPILSMKRVEIPLCPQFGDALFERMSLRLALDSHLALRMCRTPSRQQVGVLVHHGPQRAPISDERRLIVSLPGPFVHLLQAADHLAVVVLQS